MVGSGRPLQLWDVKRWHDPTFGAFRHKVGLPAHQVGDGLPAGPDCSLRNLQGREVCLLNPLDAAQLPGGSRRLPGEQVPILVLRRRAGICQLQGIVGGGGGSLGAGCAKPKTVKQHCWLAWKRRVFLLQELFF